MNLTNVRKTLPSIFTGHGPYLFFGILVLFLGSVILLAKGPTIRITIENPRFAKPIQITDPAITNQFQVFAGPGTSSNEPQSLIVDWAGGSITAPSGLETYRVSFYLREYSQPYVVVYAPGPSGKPGFVYLPGKQDEEYRTNISMILHRVEGNWFRAIPKWEETARPLIARNR